MQKRKKKILFVGAGGELASRILPSLAETYDIVGIAGKRTELKSCCVDLYTGNLLVDYRGLFDTALRAHQFDAIIWNPVKYFFTSFMESTRESLHTEFDIAVALPVECLKSAIQNQDFKGVFVLVSSLSAFGYRRDLATYSLVKNAQVRLAELLKDELQEKVNIKIVAPGSVRTISTDELVRVFLEVIENIDPQQTLYKVTER